MQKSFIAVYVKEGGGGGERVWEIGRGTMTRIPTYSFSEVFPFYSAVTHLRLEVSSAHIHVLLVM
jgi:hypothetical protein